MIVHRLYSLTFAIALASGLTAATVASAAAGDETGYTVDDVVAHFAPERDLGKPRRLCIGTASECGEPEPVAVEPFNLQVQFEFNSADLTPSAQQQLNIFAEAATGALSGARFNIDGHTDATGSETTNLLLSERRAASVVNYLTARGVSPERLVSAGHGEATP
ncbi:MAG: OmpA family protein, partial [Pseudomonadota bacterium]